MSELAHSPACLKTPPNVGALGDGPEHSGGMIAAHLSPMAFLWRNRYWATALPAAVILAYLPAVRGGFVWDDDVHLLSNPVIRPGACCGPGCQGRTWRIGR
jgi:hypothetical protein